MADTGTSTEQNALQARGEMKYAIHGLQGIFWALQMFHSQRLCDDLVGVDDMAIRNRIDQLIMAGAQITEDLQRRV